MGEGSYLSEKDHLGILRWVLNDALRHPEPIKGSPEVHFKG